MSNEVNTLEEKVLKSKFQLPNTKIRIEPIKRTKPWLGANSKNHEANFLYGNASIRVCVPLDAKGTGEYVNPFTKEEVDFLESDESRLSYQKGDLSIYRRKKENNFLGKLSYVLKDEIKILDLSKPVDYIQYKVLLANKTLIAPNLNAGTEGHYTHKQEYMFRLVEEGKKETQEASNIQIIAKAYVAYENIKDSIDKLITVMKVMRPAEASKLSRYSKIEFLQQEVGNKILENPDNRITNLTNFTKLVEGNIFGPLVMLYKAIDHKAIVLRGGEYYMAGSSDSFASTIEDACAYLLSPDNSEEVVKLSKRLKAAK